MSLTSPALQRAQEALAARKAVRNVFAPGRHYVKDGKQHDVLQLAYSSAGHHPRGGFLYFLWRYCPACNKAVVIVLKREAPIALPNAHEIGLKRVKTWSMVCAVG